MSIVVRKIVDNHFANFAEIAGEEWRLREQVEALEAWLESNASQLDPQFRWVADIGFELRRGAMGGGPPLTRNMMQLCLDANLEIWLSEYPRSRTQSVRGDQLRDTLRLGENAGSSAMTSAEQLLLAEAEDDLDSFEDEPDDEIYIRAKLLKELLKSLPDSESKRLFMLYCLYDQFGAGAGLQGELGSPEAQGQALTVRRLIDALSNQTS